jgi:heme exporter protein B
MTPVHAQNSLVTATWALLRRDVGLAWRDGGALGTALGFYLVVVTLLPLGLGPDLALLSRLAPGLLWTALLLSALLTADRLFQADHEEGALDVLAMGTPPLEMVVLAKIAAHWLTTALPLVLVTPLLGLMLNLDARAHLPLLATMLAGTPAVSAIAAIGAALTLGQRRAGMLIGLLVMPFYVPVLVFGVSSVEAVLFVGGKFWQPFAVLAAASVASLAVAPLAAAAALRATMD